MSSDFAIITHNKRRYIAGLMWKPLRAARTYLAEARALGKTDGMHAYVVVHGRVTIQAGYAPKSADATGAYALGPALIPQLGAEWVAVFEVGDGRYALLAVHAGAVLPGFDRVGDFESIRAALTNALGMLSAEADFQASGRIIAPKVFAEGDALALAGLLDKAVLPSTLRLKPLSFGLTARDALVLAAVLALVGGGVVGYMQWQAAKARAQAAAREAALAAQQVAQIQSVDAEQAPPPPPWIIAPSASDTLLSCQQFFQLARLSVAGWGLQKAQCGSTQGIVSYRRGDTGATLLAATRSAQRDYGSVGWQVSMSDDGQEMTLSTAMQLPDPRTDDTLMDFATLQTALVDQQQRVGGTAQWTLTVRPDPAPPEGKEPPPPPPWREINATLKGDLSPFIVLPGVADDGLRIASIDADVNEHGAIQWTLTGVWYAKR